jgi:hypothetical protein
MSFLRLNRFRIGLFLAAILFVAGGLPGIVAAAQGVQLQAPLCTPTGPEPAKTTESTADIYDHCQICPLAGNQPGDSRKTTWVQPLYRLRRNTLRRRWTNNICPRRVVATKRSGAAFLQLIFCSAGHRPGQFSYGDLQ